MLSPDFRLMLVWSHKEVNIDIYAIIYLRQNHFR